MNLIPEFSIVFWNGWWLSLIYYIVNQGIPLSKKGSVKRLLTAANSQNYFWKKVNCLLWVITIIFPVFVSVKFDSVIFYSGIFMYFVGMTLNVIALWNYVTTPFDQPVIKGLYRCSRNPIYVAYSLTWYGVGLALGSWLLIIINTIKVIICHFLILEEEGYCLQKYGKDYQNYLAKVPRYF